MRVLQEYLTAKRTLQTARAGPGGKPADEHRRRGKHGYVPEKAPHRPLPECQPHSIPRGPEQAAES